MKKQIFQKALAGLLISASIAGSLGMGVLGAPEVGTSTITIDGTGSEYAAYRLLDADFVLKDEECHKATYVPPEYDEETGELITEGKVIPPAHTDDCYRYTYALNDKYKDTLLQAAEDAGFDFDENKDGDISKDEVITAIHSITAKDMRTYADKLWERLKNVEPEAVTTNKKFTDMPYGHYLIVETKLASGTDSRSLVMLDTLGQGDLTVETKEGVPKVEKKILNGDKKVDAVSAAVGDTINFETTITMPKNVGELTNFSFTLHDKAEGLAKTGTVKTFVNGKEVKKVENADVPEEDGCFLHESSTRSMKWKCNCGIIVNGNSDEHVMNHVLNGESNISGGYSTMCSCFQYVSDNAPVVFAAGDVLTIRYSGKLTDKASTKQAGNVSETWVSFSNDPYNPDSFEETPHDKTTIYTYEFAVDGQDKDGKPLNGLMFTLEKKTGDTWAEVPEPSVTPATDTKSDVFRYKGLDAGTYRLKQTATQEGYTKMADTEFEIRAGFDETSDNPALKTLAVYVDGKEASGSGKAFSVNVKEGTIRTTAVNVKEGTTPDPGPDNPDNPDDPGGPRLPGTGSDALYLLYLGAAALVAGGGITLYKTRKKGA